MDRCRCTPAEAAGITQDPWHTQPHPQPATLVTIDSDPFVGETPLSAIQSWLTPNSLYYARNHFVTPDIDVSEWSLDVDGHVDRHVELTYPEIRRFTKRTLPVTMECAGNNRVDLEPAVGGNRFQGGAVSTAVWAGVPLKKVLELAGVKTEAEEVVLEGADSGKPEPGRPAIRYQRSLPLGVALHPDTLLAHEMNGEALPPDHGWPLRLVVPGWYGMASVKWLRRITVLDHAFEGFFQTERYVLPGDGDSPTPLTRMFVKSMISRPRHGEVETTGEHQVTGLAWSGEGKITRVLFSDDQGETWQTALLGGLQHPYAWRQWSASWTPRSPGHHTLLARAEDEAGNVQPTETAWNPLGYAVNGVQSVCVNVV